jgi:hypothetical protein
MEWEHFGMDLYLFDSFNKNSTRFKAWTAKNSSVIKSSHSDT